MISSIQTNTPRGIRNNNPGNIERSGIGWCGMDADQSQDPRFVVFTNPVLGIRALARVLMSYRRDGASTVKQVIIRWAPPAENDTAAYITTVARALGVKPDSEIDLSSSSTLLTLVSAIIRHENGCQPYSLDVIAEAIKRAMT